jgi:hypothetical protein
VVIANNVQLLSKEVAPNITGDLIPMYSAVHTVRDAFLLYFEFCTHILYLACFTLLKSQIEIFWLSVMKERSFH